MVSHHLSEVIEIADRVTVLREGRVVAQRETSSLDEDELVRLMLSTEAANQLAEVEAATHAHQQSTCDAPVEVAVRGLSGSVVEAFDLDLQVGEVVGFAGLVGAGHIDAAYLLSGAAPASAGTLRIGDKNLRAQTLTPRTAMRAGVGFVPGDRDAEGLFAQLAISDNVTIPRLRAFRRWGLLDNGAERTAAEGVVGLMQIRPADPRSKVGSLSGGNRQKVLLGRGLGVAQQVFVIAEPTVGVDIAAKMSIFQHIRTAADAGLPVIVASTDATDLEALCDRVLVFADGRVVEELHGADVTEGHIYQAIARSHRKVTAAPTIEGHAS
jgi:ribose transport system ATP-binding protein